MRFSKYSAFFLLVGISCNELALSQESALPLDEIVVTSSRIPQPLGQIGSSVSILSTADIQAHGNLSLPTILRQMPGINVSSNGGIGSVSSLRIRGEESFRTLTIIDGIRISDPSGPQVATQMEQVLSSGISRVEVLRGPQGLVYGADSGGVINISSPLLEQGIGIDLEAQAGGFDTQQFSGSIGGANDQGDFYIQGADFSTEGFNSQVADDVLQDNDGYDNQTWHARLGWKLSEQVRLELTHRNVDSKSEYDGCFDLSSFTTVHDCSSNYDLNATRLRLDYNATNMSHSLSYSSATTDRENLTANVPGFNAEGELERWEYMGTLNSVPGSIFVFGLDHELAGNNGDERENTGAHIEYLSDFSESLFVTGGLRYDDNEDFGQHTTYRFTTAYLLDLDNNATLKYRASVGTGFRAPSPYEVGFNEGDYAYPPASELDLQEETSFGYEAGLEYFTDNMHLQAVYFDQELDNAITFDLSGFSGYLQDAGKSDSKGIELAGTFGLGQSLSLNANYTYNDTETVSGQPRIRRPKHLANLGLMYSSETQRLKLNGFYRLSRDAEDEVNGSRVALDDFGVIDISASYLFGQNIVLFGRVENLTNEAYNELAGFNAAGRAAYLGLRISYH